MRADRDKAFEHFRKLEMGKNSHRICTAGFLSGFWPRGVGKMRYNEWGVRGRSDTCMLCIRQTRGSGGMLPGTFRLFAFDLMYFGGIWAVFTQHSLHLPGTNYACIICS